jgi:hypothetical protein
VPGRPERTRDREYADRNAEEGELERRHEPVPDQLGDRILTEVGLAEVSVNAADTQLRYWVMIGRSMPASWRSRSIVSG